MRFLRAILLLIVLAFIPSFANAADATSYNPCDHLAELYKQKSTIEYQGIAESCAPKVTVAQQVAQSAQTAQNVATVAKGIGEGLGEGAKGVGGAISDLAKNLGVTVNEFLKSPAGTLIAFVLVIKFIGGKLFAVPFVMFMVGMWWFINNRISRDVTYEFHPILWGAFQVRRVASVTRERDDYNTGVFAILMLILTLVVGLNL
jgi:hypothetical protein